MKEYRQQHYDKLQQWMKSRLLEYINGLEVKCPSHTKGCVLCGGNGQDKLSITKLRRYLKYDQTLKPLVVSRLNQMIELAISEQEKILKDGQ